MTNTSDHTYTLTLTVRNRPGVLVRCAQVLSRRGQNIESLKVDVIPARPDVSKMIIAARGKKQAVDQIIAQLNKLIDVLNIE